jgi:hypothetical protein
MPTISLKTDKKTIRLKKRWTENTDFINELELPDLPDIPGMITPNERNYLYWLVSQTYLGEGEIVEIGSWMGKSTVSLAAGLRDSAMKGHVYAFDRFVWHENDNIKTSLNIKHGSDFKHIFEQNTHLLNDYIKATKSELSEVKWNNKNIEILFLDGPKRLKQIKQVLKIFGPHLIPNLSIIVMQDFGNYPSYDLSVICSSLREYIQVVHAVPNSSTVSFKVIRKLEYDQLDLNELDFHTWSYDKAITNWNWINSQLPVQTQKRLAPGLAFFLHDIGYIDKAKDYIRENKEEWLNTQKWAFGKNTSLYDRYKELFIEIEIKRSISDYYSLFSKPSYRHYRINKIRKKLKVFFKYFKNNYKYFIKYSKKKYKYIVKLTKRIYKHTKRVYYFIKYQFTNY